MTAESRLWSQRCPGCGQLSLPRALQGPGRAGGGRRRQAWAAVWRPAPLLCGCRRHAHQAAGATAVIRVLQRREPRPVARRTSPGTGEACRSVSSGPAPAGATWACRCHRTPAWASVRGGLSRHPLQGRGPCHPCPCPSGRRRFRMPYHSNPPKCPLPKRLQDLRTSPAGIRCSHTMGKSFRKHSW